MSLVRTPAILLRKRDYSETSLVVVFFTQDFGKLHFLIKGAKKKSSSYSASFEHGACYELLFLHRSGFKGLSVLREAHLQEDFVEIRKNMDSFYHASYCLELLDQFTELEDTHPALFKTIFEVLKNISEKKYLHLNVRYFELSLLRELGLWGGFSRCSVCDQLLEAKFFLNSATARPFCHHCFGIHYGGEVFQMNILKTLDQLEKRSFQEIPKEMYDGIRKFLWFCIDFHLEKPLKSRKFLLQN